MLKGKLSLCFIRKERGLIVRFHLFNMNINLDTLLKRKRDNVEQTIPAANDSDTDEGQVSDQAPEASGDTTTESENKEESSETPTTTEGDEEK